MQHMFRMRLVQVSTTFVLDFIGLETKKNALNNINNKNKNQVGYHFFC